MKIYSLQRTNEALMRFRLADRPRRLWIDAVCINQSDKAEKGCQVPLMARIYTQATEVLIWLGEEKDGSDHVMEYLRRIGQARLDIGGEIKEPRDEPHNTAIWADVIQDPSLEKTHLVLDRPWFSRRWIIQETVLARRPIVHYGAASMHWDVICHAVTALSHLGTDGSHFWDIRKGNRSKISHSLLYSIPVINKQRDALRDTGKQRNPRLVGEHMLDCIDRARPFDCKDDRDRVFALLGVMGYHEHIALGVGYETTVADVYTAFARYCLERGEIVELLAWAGESKLALMQQRLDVPSWVPD